MTDELPLRDLHLPDPVGWWPPAIGWWLLATAVLAVAVVLALLVRRYIRKRDRRAALAVLAVIGQRYRQNRDVAEALQSLSALLRRAAITAFPEDGCAALTGESWLAFLDRTGGGGRFGSGPGRALTDAPYRPAADADVDALLALSDTWLRSLPMRPGR